MPPLEVPSESAVKKKFPRKTWGEDDSAVWDFPSRLHGAGLTDSRPSVWLTAGRPRGHAGAAQNVRTQRGQKWKRHTREKNWQISHLVYKITCVGVGGRYGAESYQ